MKSRLILASLLFWLASLFCVTCFSTPPACAAAKVDPVLEQGVDKDGSTGYIIYFKARAALSGAYAMEWKDRGRFVMESLQATAAASQAGVRAYLEDRNARHKSFWIGNMIVVEESDLATFTGLKDFPEIDRIGQRPEVILYEPVERGIESPQPMGVEPNLAHVRVDQVWALGIKGNGMVVANIDTGVRYTHQALVNQYRGSLGGGSFDHNYNWWDPYGDHTIVPADDNGHGTHTMGTMVGYDGGSNQIGMAPDAKWMACRGCNTNTCTDAALLECAEFIAAPWDLNKSAPDPDLRPHVVNNSWGGCGRVYDDWFRDVVDAWHAAGIHPVFSNGNSSNCGYQSPPGCNTVGNPARYGNVTGVGSSGNSDGQYATHSNWGPTDNPDRVNPGEYPYLKPQVLAPGVNIRSSVNTGDASYESGWSGTSMSAPHVTGLIALMYSACPMLTRQYGTVETILQITANPIPYDSGCGGEGPGNVPNNATGWGEIDALAAVERAVSVCQPWGSLKGRVLDAATREPIRNAAVRAGESATRTNTAGEYTMPYLAAGQYAVTVSAFGYYDESAQVTILKDSTTTADFSLAPKKTVKLTGRVKDGSGAEWPLYATIVASSSNTDVRTVTDPRTGAYRMRLYKDTDYVLRVSSPGYATAQITLTTTGKFSPKNFSLAVGSDCSAPGYASSGDGCIARKGGIITGLVKDGNTKKPVGGIVVDSLFGQTTSDSNGRYVIFSPAGRRPLAANPSTRAYYGVASKWVTPAAGKVVTSDFDLPAAMFKGPKKLSVTLARGSTKTVRLKLRNAGGLPGTFFLSDQPVTSTDTAAQPLKVSLPPSEYEAPADAEGASTGLAPKTGRKTLRSPAAAIFALTGSPAYAFAVDVNGSQLGTFDCDAPGTWTNIGAESSHHFLAGDFLNDDFSRLYVLDYYDNGLYAVDTRTVVATPIGYATPYSGDQWSGMASAVGSGKLYASSTNCLRSALYAIDPATGASSWIGEITNATCIIDIAMNAEDEMYGVDVANDTLVKIDPRTGKGKVIGSIGFNANFGQDLSFEKQSGVLYYAAYPYDGWSGGPAQLRIVDTKTGNTTLVGQLLDGPQVDCLAFAVSTDAPWLRQSLSTGTLDAKKTRSVTVTFDAAGVSPGTYHGRIKVAGNTPYDSFFIPVTMKVTAGKPGRTAGGSVR